MRTCQSCGGIIGRDCFNPVECAFIFQQEKHANDQNQYAIGHHEGYQQGYAEGSQSANSEDIIKLLAALHELRHGIFKDEDAVNRFIDKTVNEFKQKYPHI